MFRRNTARLRLWKMSVSNDHNTSSGDSPADEGSKDATGSSLASAIARFDSALKALDDAVDARIRNSPTDDEAASEVQRMADDRSRLAQSLDAPEAKSNRLAEANGEVARRLVGAMETIRGVLDKKEQ